MKLTSFARFVGQKWRRTSNRRKRSPRLAKPSVLLLEDRLSPAVLPPALVSNPISLGTGISPQVVIDPLNPLKVVEVNTIGTPLAAGSTTPSLAGLFSNDGGQTWHTLNLPLNLLDPNLNPPGTIPSVPFAFVSSPSITFDNTQSFYIVASEHDAAFGSGAIVLEKYSFTGLAPTRTITDNVLYRWFNQDPAYNPVVAADTNQASFTDPTTGQTQTDSLAAVVNDPTFGPVPKALYVAWNTNFTEPSGAAAATTSNIVVVASADGGHHFTTQEFVSDPGLTGVFADPTAPQGSAPHILFTQGTAKGSVPGGQLTFFWNSTPPLGTPGYSFNQITMDRSRPDGTAAAATQQFTGTTGAIADAGSNASALTQPGTNYDVGTNPTAIAFGDFFFLNGKGHDIVTVNSDGTITALKSNGDGTYGSEVVTTLPSGDQPIAVVSGAFLGPMAPDGIAILNQNSNFVSIFTGNGDGTFTFAENLVAGNGPSALVVGKFNSDAAPDLAVANEKAGTVSVFLGNVDAMGNPTGSFQSAKVFAVSASPNPMPVGLAVGDINGDKNQDLVTANSGTNEIGILLGNGNGTFALQKAISLGKASPAAVALGDVNKDGIPDLAEVSANGAGQVFVGNGNGTFLKPNAFTTAGSDNNLVIGDFNKDGNPDIATASVGSGFVSVVLGNGDGTFGAATNYAAHLGPTALVSGDINGDGFSDVAVANLNSGDVTILLGSNTSNTAETTLFTSSVNITDPNINVINDFQVTLSVTHPHLNELQIVLLPPTDSGLSPIYLLRNQVDAAGNTLSQGVADQANLGTLNGFPLGTVFDDNAPRSITDSTAAAPFVGHFKPEVGSLLFGLPFLTKAEVQGVWTLQVTDFRNDSSPTQSVDGWKLNFSSHISTTGFGVDSTVMVPGLLGPTPVTPVVGAVNNVYPLVTAASGTPGIGPGIAAAVDNTLGSFSPFQGRMYLTYTGPVVTNGVITDTNIYLISSNDNGFTWSSPLQVNDDAPTDNFSEGNRPQFMPSLAVDQATGSVVVSYYDGRWDPALTRVANSLSASINGGQSFSQSVLLNPPSTAINAITGQSTFIEPIPGNQGQAGPLGFGDRAGLAVYGGHIYPMFSSNLNAAGANVMTATVTIAAGPRIIQGDMGPVANSFTVNGVTYNNTFAPDGTRQLTAFVVTFDRLIDPHSFGAADVRLMYQNPTLPASMPTDESMDVHNVMPLDGNSSLATTFLVQLLNPLSMVGAYSYSVGPNIRDGIRTIGAGGLVNPGNFMDQDMNAVPNEPNVDAFAAPRPLNGIPFQLPYDSNTLPLIIPGPHVVSTFVPGNPPTADNLVLNQSASAIDVVFDRDINASTFTAANILQMIGPLGPITGPFTVTALTSIDKRTFQIGFPTQKLSGTYTLVLSPSIQDTSGHAVDTNLNAGLDVLRGSNPTNAATTTNTFTSITPVTIGANQTVTSNLSIASVYQIVQNAAEHIQLRLDITYQPDPNLSAVLIAPDGTRIRLFTNVGNFGPPPQANFQNTLFDDFAAKPDGSPNPIQLGSPPFAQGPFNPQTPLSALLGKASNGVWSLAITNIGSSTGTLNSWSLILPQAVSGTGLGEAVADQIPVSFRIFVQDPTNAVSSTMWTPVGPAPINSGQRSGRIGGLAVDPSDPSGNTVFVAGASGGVWKTNNFLTTSPNGPTWIPLTDLGPTTSLNTGSIAVFGRNNDPSQTIIFVATGEGDTGTPGVGFLRSMDGGKTWAVLDSAMTNVDATGAVLPLSSPMRDHKFVGDTAFKVIVDAKALPSGQVAVYAALSGTTGGIWRSTDTGNTWQLVRAGNATDVVLAAGSYNPSGNPQILYGAFQGDGVYMTTSALTATTMTQMAGGQGDLLRRNIDVIPDQPIPVTAPADTPNGAKGRIDLAGPVLTNNPVADLNYQGWLYAAVITSGGAFDGLYMTKDFGNNWTKISLPTFSPFAGVAYPTNDDSQPTYDPFAHSSTSGGTAQGNYDISFAIDPNNPNVVYLGGTNDNAPQPAGGMIRVDVTNLSDPYAEVAYDNSAPDGGLVQFATTGPVSLTNPGMPYGFLNPNNPFIPPQSPYYNLLRDPNNPFLAPATTPYTNIATFNNQGTGAFWMPFNDVTGHSTNQHRLIAVRDALTGQTRLILGDDQGVFTGVDMGNGILNRGIGTAPEITGNRNGNLQITQFYYGAVQPSVLAAQVAGALFYGNSMGVGFPTSTGNILSTGNLNWTGPPGNGTGIATDQTGSGQSYSYVWPCCGAHPFPTDFFLVTLPSGQQVSRTTGLIQPGDDPGTGAGEWPSSNIGSNFAVNPIDPTGIVMSSQAISPGPNIFRTFGPLTGTGIQWFIIAGPSDLDGTYAPALAFGAPNPSSSGALDDFIYAGTQGGNIYVTFSGGGPGGWTKISTGLDGSQVNQIVTDPVRGSHDAYAVTNNGVYYMPDSTQFAAKGFTWYKISDNPKMGYGPLTTLTRPIFNNPNDPFPTLNFVTTIQADWRFAIPNKITYPNGPTTHPVLYVGGEGGVFRSFDGGATWNYYPDVTIDGAVQEGGLIPDNRVTALSLALGNINPATGFADPSGGLNMLVATTFGRGTFAIRLDNKPFQQFLVAPNAGPHIVSSAVVSPNPGTQLTGFTVTFAGPVDPTTFTPSKLTVTGPSGQALTVQSVVDVTPTGPGDLHNIYQINLATPQTQTGNYTLLVGPNITDFSGNLMDQDQDNVNGQIPDDQYLHSLFFTPNTAPSLSFIPNQITVPNTPVGPIPFTVGDAQTGASSVTVTSSSSNQTVVPNANLVIGGTGANRTITITPATNQTGTATITVTATDPQGLSTSETFQFVVDVQPLLSAINDQTVPHTQGPLSVQLTASSPTNLPLTLRAEIFGYSKAYALKQQLGLFLNGSLYYNSFGQKEEWMFSSVQNKWYVIFPDGELKAWDGTPNSFATSPTVETLDPAFWSNPSLLFNAPVPVAPVVTTSIDQNSQRLTLTPPTGYTGMFQVTVTASDGFLTTRQSFLVSITDPGPVLSAIDNQTTTTGNAVKVQLAASDADGETPVLTAAVSGYSQAYDLNQQLHLFVNGSLFFNSFGQREEWLFSAVQSKWYVILPTGSLLQWDGTPHSFATSPQVAQLDTSIYNMPSLLYNAQAPVAPTGVTTSINQGTQMLTVTPPAGFTGTFRVTVAATDNIHTAQQSFLVLVSAAKPVVKLAAINNQTIPHTQSSLSVQLNAIDANSKPLTLHADVFGYSKAYALKQQLGLFLNGSLFFNSFGQKDEWIFSSVQNKWYVLFPDGELKAWDGTPNSFATSPTVETLDPAFWQDPSLLYNAAVPVAPAVTVSIDQNTQLMTITPPTGYTGTFQVTVSAADGSAADRKSFLVTVTDQAPVLAAVNNQTVKQSQLPLAVNLSASDANNDLKPLVATVQGFSQAFDLEQQLGLFVNGSLFFNQFGQKEEWLFSSVQSKWYVILPDGELLQWDGTPNSLATSPLVARLSPSVWQNPSLLFNAQRPVAPSGVTASINQATQVLTVNAPSGFTGVFRVLVAATDGIHTTQESFLVTVTS
jgi:subtilisin-like proprotein convertase family protein